MLRNLILFVVLSAAVIAGWFWAVNTFTPETKKEVAQEKKDQDKKDTDKPKEPDVKKLDQKEPKKESDPKKLAHAIAGSCLSDAVVDARIASASETLGGDGYHLTVTTTTRGAGIRRVV